MKNYIHKKPVQATQFNGEYTEEMAEWIQSHECFGKIQWDKTDKVIGLFVMDNYISDYNADIQLGDWIVYDESRDFPFFCCTDGNFKEEFELVDEEKSNKFGSKLDFAANCLLKDNT
jgi:hypothetical protein